MDVGNNCLNVEALVEWVQKKAGCRCLDFHFAMLTCCFCEWFADCLLLNCDRGC